MLSQQLCSLFPEDEWRVNRSNVSADTGINYTQRSNDKVLDVFTNFMKFDWTIIMQLFFFVFILMTEYALECMQANLKVQKLAGLSEVSSKDCMYGQFHTKSVRKNKKNYEY